MRKIVLTSLLLTIAAYVSAQTADEYDTHHPNDSSSSAASSAPTPPADIQQMQGNMADMKTMMAKIAVTKDPAERAKLLDQHMHAMEKQMGMMGSMMKSASSSDMTHCQQMMGGEADMMNAMMDQMKQHQAAGAIDPRTH